VSTLDNFRKEAKRWLKALRAGDRPAVERLRSAYPQAQLPPTLRDVQHALACEHGFDNWAALKASAIHKANNDTDLTALLKAAEGNDLVALLEILARDPDLIDQRGTLEGHTGLRTALHFGVRHERIVAALLEHGADPNIRDEGDNAFPLHFVAETNTFSIVRLLVEHGADPIGAGDHHELEVIGWATVFGKADSEVVNYLLTHGAVHNIFSAIATGAIADLRRLAGQSPADVNRKMDRTNLRRTPLHLAVVKKQPAALPILIAHGAALDATDASGLTALDQAALDGERDMAQILIDRGAPIGLPAAVALDRPGDIERALSADPDSLKPGHLWERLIVRAGASSSGKTIETLLRYGAAINALDDPATSVDEVRGYTALHSAGWNGNADAAAVLVAHGADLSIRDGKYCATPAGWADYAGHAAVRDLILEGQIDVFEAIDFDLADRIPGILQRDPGALTRPFSEYWRLGQTHANWARSREVTPLVYAVEEKKVVCAEVLIAQGADGSSRRAAAGADRDHAERVGRFLQFACWDHHVHGKGDHRMYDRAAQRLLTQYPEIGTDCIYTAVVAGNLSEVERFLSVGPDMANEPGGSRGWPPLVYLCFARFSNRATLDNAVAIARLLLDRGADPNAFYKAGDANYTALVGVAGEGEQDSPRQARAAELFELLLEHGARPFDIQVLYNTHFSGDMIWWLELVYRHTVARGQKQAWDDPNWLMLGMGGYGPGAYFILNCALEKNDLVLAEWALARGARPDPHGYSHPRFHPKHTLYERAVLEGKAEMAGLLANYGAQQSVAVLDDEEAFIASCMRLDREEIRRRLQEHPEYLRSPRAIFTAARRDRADVVAHLLDLGVPLEIEGPHKNRILHEAAGANALSVVQLLVERGAEVDPRESEYGAAPIGFAAYGDKLEVLEYLSRYSRNVWTLTFRGYVDRLRDIMRDEPALARIASSDGVTPLWWLPDDEGKALAIAKLLLEHGANPAAVSKDGSTAADWARKRGMLGVARLLAVEKPDPA
jgi:ankyrin repeat protein